MYEDGAPDPTNPLPRTTSTPKQRRRGRRRRRRTGRRKKAPPCCLGFILNENKQTKQHYVISSPSSRKPSMRLNPSKFSSFFIVFYWSKLLVCCSFSRTFYEPCSFFVS
jgi:hypothetical protein